MDKIRQDSGEVDIISGEVMAKSKAKKGLSKTHKDYWKERVERIPYRDKVSGEWMAAGEYSIRLTHQKRREYFALHSANRKIAGDKAKEIYSSLKVNGWDATLAKYKPSAEAAPEIETVGDLIEEAKKVSEVTLNTLNQYCGALRRIVSSIRGIDSDDRKKYRPGGSDWQVKVDRVKLSVLTSDKVQAWRKRQLEGLNPADRKKKVMSVDSTLNRVRSIWKHSGLLSPFEGLKWKATVKRFQPTVDAVTLLYWAEEELREQEPEQFKAFTLCLFLGLRRKEADCLAWGQIDFERGKVRIETTEHFKPKSDNSEREIPIQESLLPQISRWRNRADAVFILDGGDARPQAGYAYYRCKSTWKKLSAWLRSKGVESSKPIHYLRKLSGSLMYGQNDVLAAQRFLGHADIRTTIGSYVHEGDRTFDLVSVKPEPKSTERVS